MEKTVQTPGELKNVQMKFMQFVGFLRLGQYKNGRLAIELVDPEGFFEVIACITVNITAAFDPLPNHIYVKDYSENTGMAKALEDAGIAKTVVDFTVGYSCRVVDMEIIHPEVLKGIKQFQDWIDAENKSKQTPDDILKQIAEPGTSWLCKTDGTVTKIDAANKKNGFKLKEVYSLLDIRIVEVCRCENDRIILADEEGMFQQNPKVNPVATAFYQKSYGEEVGIVGDCIICDNNMFQ